MSFREHIHRFQEYEALDVLEGEDREHLNVIYSPSYVERSDTGRVPIRERIVNELIHCSGMVGIGEARGGFSVAASPHTPVNAPVELYRAAVHQATANKSFRSPPQPSFPHELRNQPRTVMPLHMTTFWYRGDSYERCDFNDIGNLLPSERINYYAVLQENMKAMYGAMRDLIDTTAVRDKYGLREEHIKKLLEDDTLFFFLVGHGYLPDQERTGLGRGTMSNPDGHANLVFLPTDHLPYERRGASASEIANEQFPNHLYKQVSPYDTMFFSVMELLGGGESTTDGQLLRAIPYIDRGDPKKNKYRRPYYEGLHFDTTDEQLVSFPMALEAANRFISRGQRIYSTAMHFFEQYHKQAGNVRAQRATQMQFAETLMAEFTKDEHAVAAGKRAAGIVELSKLIFHRLQPTYMQLTGWLNGNGQLDETARAELSNRRAIYEKRFKRFQDVAYRTNHIERMMKRFNISRNAATALTEMEEDTYRDTYRNYPQTEVSRRTMPVRFSASVSMRFSFNDDGSMKLDDQGNAQVQEFTIAPRFSEKGVFEDAAGCTVVRETGF